MSGEPPEGYLGAEARIRSGPAPELVEAGYALELGDAPLLHRGIGLADLAHVLVLGEQGVIPPEDERELLRALLELLDADVAEFVATRGTGTSPTRASARLEQRIGQAAGWLNAGRPRREAGRIAFRLALREGVLELAAAVVRHAGALVELAARERDTLILDYTYLQACAADDRRPLGPFLRVPGAARRRAASRRPRPGSTGAREAPAGSTARASRSTDERIAGLLGFSAPVDAHARRHVADRRPRRPRVSRRDRGDRRQSLRRGPRGVRER